MRSVWLAADSIVSPLGNSVEENFNALREGRSGITQTNNSLLSTNSPFLSLIPGNDSSEGYTRFEAICVKVLKQLFTKADIQTSNTLLILSTTKGNIELLDSAGIQDGRLKLHHTATFLAHQFGIKDHIVVSNACVSGAMAMLIGKRFIDSGAFEQVIVLGADVISPFIVKGFESLHALSDNVCRPFDAKRNGINLGEAAAAVLLTNAPEKTGVKTNICILGGATSSDANHISGPSRTGAELAFAIRSALSASNIETSGIDFISAHGTATIYNDEMESKAYHLAGVQQAPVHSLKAYYGHTLGASALLETLIGAECLRRNELIASAGFEEMGVSQPLNIIREAKKKNITTFLKTSSGFGGCNAVVVLKKYSA